MALRAKLAVVGMGACALFTPSAHAAEQGDELIYPVKRGDTLIGLGTRLLAEPTDWKKLRRLNRIRNPHYIVPGAKIRIPVAWLRALPAPAKVLEVEGDTGGIESGALLSEGEELLTGNDGYVTLELADGSRLTLQSGSRLMLKSLSRYPETDLTRSDLQLDSGRVESTVAPQHRGAGRFEIRTPVAVTAVRGTRFRVAMREKAARTEVLAGRTEVAGVGTAAPTLVLDAGFGTLISGSRKPLRAVKLLAAPDLSRLPALAERALVRFNFDAVPGAAAYRAQVARDSDFQEVISGGQFEEPEAKFSDLPDGEYWLRIRAVDELELEGLDAHHPFRLKARPEPPFPSAPRNSGRASGESVELQWTHAAEAATYRVQLARDPGFTELVKDEPRILGQTLQIDAMIPGVYHWRIASVRENGDQGPFGDSQHFIQKPLPAIPEPPTMDEKDLNFRWVSEPKQTFRLQVARDERFANLVGDITVAQPEATLPRLEAGTYYLRVQATDPDGYVGPYSATQRFEVPREPVPWWLLLLPLLGLLL